MRFRAAVVGCGRIGAEWDMGRDGPPLTHGGALRAHPDVDLALAVDADAAAAERAGAAFGCDVATSVDALAKCGCDFVSVATPPEGRAELVAGILERCRPRSLWIEKPLATTAAEARSLLRACADADVGVQVNFLRRFDQVWRRVVADVREAGGPVHADVRYSGTLANFGSHAIDFVHWVAGPIVEVSGTVLGDRELVGCRTEPFGTATLMQLATPDATAFDVSLRTPSARWELSALGEDLCGSERGPSRLFPGTRVDRLEARASDGLVGAMTGGVASLVAAARGDAPLLCTGDDGLRALLVHEAAVAALAGRTHVPVPSSALV